MAQQQQQQEQGIIYYDDGSIYRGGVKSVAGEGKRHGKGKMTYLDGSFYKGEWKNDQRHGKGKMVYANGGSYDGDWKDDKMHGEGHFKCCSNKCHYDGAFKEDKKHGKGVHIYSDGSIYEGEFKENNKHGKGKMIYPNGGSYEGEFKENQRHGKGVYNYPDGSIYDGEWKDNKMDGKGKLIFPGESFYEGDWKDDKKNGRGKIVYSDGESYEGEWKDNKMDGKGKMIHPSGGSYEGDWKDDKKDGKGKMIHPSGGSYEGDWKDDKMDGKGKLIYPDKRSYVGDWKDDKRDGKGKLTYPSGGSYEGDWKDDKMDGKGKRIFYPGYFYEGEWKEDKKHGKGIETSLNNIYDGEWKDGQRHGKGKMTYLDGPYKSYEGDWKDGLRDGRGKMTNSDGTIKDGKWKENKFMIYTKFKIKVQLNTGEELEITVLPNETVHRVMEIISQEIGRDTSYMTIFRDRNRLRPNATLSKEGIKNGDLLLVYIDDISKPVIEKLFAYLYNDEENAITQEQFLTLPPDAVGKWMTENRFHDVPISSSVNTIQQEWEFMKKQRSYRDKQGFPSYWIQIFADLVLNTGFKLISLPILGLILDSLLKRYGYRGPRLQRTKDCILQVMKKYESRQFHVGNTFLARDSYGNLQKVIAFEEEPIPRFTDGNEIYEASTILEPIVMDRKDVNDIISKSSKPIADSILTSLVNKANKSNVEQFEFHQEGDAEWFEFVDSKDIITAIGFIDPGFNPEFINPYQEIYVKSSAQFWPHLSVLQQQDTEEAFPTHIIGLIHDYKIEGRVILYFNGYNVEGWGWNGVLKGAITRYCPKNGETQTGHVRNKTLDGLVSMHHHPDNFREFKIKPTRTVLTYKEGIPQIDKKVTVFYENGDIEDGFFSSKLSSSKPPRRILVEGTRASDNLICYGKFDFKTGALSEGEAQYDSHKHDTVIEDQDLDLTEEVISLKEIARGIYPHEDQYKGQWNPKNGVLVEGTITHSDGSIDMVKKGKVVRNTPSTSKTMIVPTPRFDKALFQLEKHRKELQQINRKRIDALRLGESKPDYRKALFDKYRGVVGKTHASVRAPLQTLLQQGKTNILLRKQFMRRLYQDEPSQKQLLEILLRILYLYENDRKNIVTRIRVNLKELNPKTLRNKDVLPTVMKSLFDDGLLREPAMEEMDLIYVPYDGKQSLIELIYTMAPKELKLGDDLGKKFKDKGIEELMPLIDDLISILLGNIATHLPMKVLQKITGLTGTEEEEEKEEEEDAMAYFFLQQQQQQQPHPKQKQKQQKPTDIRIDALSWNISWLDIKDHPALLSSTIRLLETITLSSDFILLQETPFDPVEFRYFNALLEETGAQNLSVNVFHRAVVQPYLNVPGMKNQIHGMMIMARSSAWEIVQRKKPQSHMLRPLIYDKDASQGAIVTSMPARLFYSEPEIAAEQDLNRQAVWYSTEPMKDDRHEPHIFAKLSTLSGLFRSKTIPSFYMIVMNIHIRRIGYDAYYRKRLLRDINEQIRLYKEYLEKIKASSFGILIGGDFNRTDYYIITEILNGIPALRNGHVIMNPIPIMGKPPIDAFLIPDHVTATPQFIEPQWQQAQRQLLETVGSGGGGGAGIASIFPQGGHTPFNILLTFPLT